jgi:hypothetical protein
MDCVFITRKETPMGLAQSPLIQYAEGYFDDMIDGLSYIYLCFLILIFLIIF